MSRIGKLPIKIPQGVSVEISGGKVITKGPKGTLGYELPKGITYEMKDDTLALITHGQGAHLKTLHGTTRSKISNNVFGVSNGWSKELELVGTGFRAEVSANSLVLQVGYSHPVKIVAPEGIVFGVTKNIISVVGADREVVGQVAANIREVRVPEPYKGKGIRYKDEIVRKKAGKAAKTEGGVAA